MTGGDVSPERKTESERAKEMTTENTTTATSETARLTVENVSLYFRGEFFGNYSRIDCRRVEIWRGKYAQYSSAVFCEFTPKGKRKALRIVQDYQPSLVVLRGEQFEPAPFFGESVNGVSQSRYSSHAPEWHGEFRRMLAEHVAKTGAVVIFDASPDDVE